MTFEQIVAVALGINALISLGNALYMIMSAPGSRAIAGIKELTDTFKADAELRARQRQEAESRFQVLETRVGMIERDLKHLPTKESVSEVKLEISKIEGAVGKLDEKMAGISRTVNLLDEYLRQGDRA